MRQYWLSNYNGVVLSAVTAESAKMCTHLVEMAALAAEREISRKLAEVLQHAIDIGYFAEKGSTIAWAGEVLAEYENTRVDPLHPPTPDSGTPR